MKLIKSLKEEVVPLSSKQSLILYLIIACIFQFVLFYAPTLAAQAVEETKIQEFNTNEDFILLNEIISKTEEIDKTVTQNFLPQHQKRQLEVLRESKHAITAYNSDPRQTDDSPCITANGFNVCKHGIEDTVAANFLKFGTKVKIPELFGDRIFVVRDRMNKRYSNRVDIWMKDYNEARQFGVKTAMIQVVK